MAHLILDGIIMLACPIKLWEVTQALKLKTVNTLLGLCLVPGLAEYITITPTYPAFSIPRKSCTFP